MIEYVLVCQRPLEHLSTGLGVTEVFQKLIVEKDPVIFAVGTDLAILGLVSRGAAIEHFLCHFCWEGSRRGLLHHSTPFCTAAHCKSY